MMTFCADTAGTQRMWIVHLDGGTCMQYSADKFTAKD